MLLQLSLFTCRNVGCSLWEVRKVHHQFCIKCVGLHIYCLTEFFSAENLFLSFCIKTFRCGVVPCNREVKISFGKEYKWVNNSVGGSVDFTSKYCELSRKWCLVTMTRMCLKPALYVKTIVLDFWTVPEGFPPPPDSKEKKNLRVHHFPQVQKVTSGK